MIIARRNFLKMPAGALLAGTVGRSAEAQTGPRTPAASSLQSGDLLWPKKPGEFIPYQLPSGQNVDEDRERWLKEKEAFPKKARSSKNEEDKLAADRIAPLTYNDFRALYLRNQNPDQITPYGLGGIIGSRARRHR